MADQLLPFRLHRHVMIPTTALRCVPSAFQSVVLFRANYRIIPKYAEFLLFHTPEGYDPVILNGTGV